MPYFFLLPFAFFLFRFVFFLWGRVLALFCLSWKVEQKSDTFQWPNHSVTSSVSLPFFLVFFSLSFSPDVWNIDAEPAPDFFLDLLDCVSSSLSSLSDFAAAREILKTAAFYTGKNINNSASILLRVKIQDEKSGKMQGETFLFAFCLFFPTYLEHWRYFFFLLLLLCLGLFLFSIGIFVL